MRERDTGQEAQVTYFIYHVKISLFTIQDNSFGQVCVSVQAITFDFELNLGTSV